MRTRAVPPSSAGRTKVVSEKPISERERLHRLVVELARVREDRELVARERGVGEDVDDDVAEASARAAPYPGTADAYRLRPCRTPSSSPTCAKSYGSTEALRGVSFEVAEGEVFGLLGPNGAGKTTTVEILEGYRSRDGGDATVLGHDPGSTPNASCASGSASSCSSPS